jgi:hypothetical protein
MRLVGLNVTDRRSVGLNAFSLSFVVRGQSRLDPSMQHASLVRCMLSDFIDIGILLFLLNPEQ